MSNEHLAAEAAPSLRDMLRALPKVKFTLPVHACLGGWRHLGGGEFTAFAPSAEASEATRGLSMQIAPMLLELVRDEADVLAEAPKLAYEPAFMLTPYVDPLDSAESVVRFIAVASKPAAEPVAQATDGGPNPNYNPDAGAQMLEARVTPDMITAAIVGADYHVLPDTQITVCTITLRNGTKVLGYNYGAIDPARQDWAQGRQAAYDMAREKVWELEGYALRERLANRRALILNLTEAEQTELKELIRNSPPGFLVPAADPDADKGAQLLAIVRAFLDKHHVSCPETIHQTDRVIENAYGFIEDLANVAGYYRYPDEEDAA